MSCYSLYGTHMIARAQAFATAAHAAIGQKRTYTGEPYIVHPRAVAELVAALPRASWQQVVCAWLHDTVEDTQITLTHIRDSFGDEIAEGLFYLTNVEREAGNRRKRHQINVERLAKAPGWIQDVKLADIKDNTKNLAVLPRDFARLFLSEKEDVMCVLTSADPVFWSLVNDQIHQQKLELANVQEA